MKCSSWRPCTLGDVIELQRGYDLPEYERRPGTVPVIGSFGITGYHDQARAPGPGVTVGRSGASFGVVTYSEQAYWPHNAVLFVTDFKNNIPRFIAYLLKTIDFQRLNSGSAQPSLNRNYVYTVQTALPDRETQRKIASILSAYDDLIENNMHRIAVLEAMAQAIYREWFVEFRFPGHEKVKLVDSPVGTIPEGWRIKPLREIADLRLGKMLDAKKNKGELMPYLANVNVRWGEFDLQNLRQMRFEVDEREAYGLRYGDIVMCEGGEPGRCAIWTERVPNMMIQKAIHRIRSREEVNFHYLYWNLRHKGQTGHLESLFTGATIKHLPREKLDIVAIEVPRKNITDLFSKTVGPMAGQVEALRKINANLRKTRELLLPKLISGQVSVENLDLETAEATIV